MTSFSTAFELSHGPLRYISTSNIRLDLLLDGGARCGEVLEISGASGSGKSQLVMAMSVLCNGPSVIIDTSHGICPERLAQIASCNSTLTSTSTSTTSTAPLPATSLELHSLQNVVITNVHDIFQLYETLENIASTTSLLIIDCISIFIATEFGKGYSGQAAVEGISNMLRAIAREYNTAVVVTNGVVSDRRSKHVGTTKPALGRVWSFTPDRRLMLSSSDDYNAPQKINASDYKCGLTVTAKGIELRT